MEIILPLIFAFFAMICWGFGDFFIQRSTRRLGDVETMAFIGIIGAIILSPLIIQEISLLLNPADLSFLGILCVVITATALITFEAFKKGKLSVTEVLIELELPVTIALGFLFFNETPTMIQLGIILLVFIGLVLVATKSFKHYRKAFERGAILALIAAVLMGSTNFLIGASSRELAPLITIWAAWLFSGIIGLIIIYKREGFSRFGKNLSKFKTLVILTTIFDTISWVFFAFAIKDSNIGIITAITESYVVIGLVLGLLVNKEKIAWHQALGGALAIFATILLAITLIV